MRAVWPRPDVFAWLLHRAVLDDLLSTPERILTIARDRLAGQRVRDTSGHEGELWAAWAELLDGTLVDLAAVLIGCDESARYLRSTTPFVGIIDSDRRAVAFVASRLHSVPWLNQLLEAETVELGVSAADELAEARRLGEV